MSPATLYKICVKKTGYFLRCGVWRSCEQNPFSSIPPSVVQTLMDSMLSSSHATPYCSSTVHDDIPSLVLGTNADDVHLLLTCGLLKHLNLLGNVLYIRNTYSLYFDPVRLLQKLSLGCQNLETLALPRLWSNSDDASRTLETLLQRSPKLEELHTPIYFGPGNLEICKKLTILRLHYDTYEMVEAFSLILLPEHLKCLESLGIFSVCNLEQYELDVPDACYVNEGNGTYIKLAAMVLDNCLKVTSLGCIESSFALKHLLGRQSTELSVSRSFQLRKCFWGIRFPQKASFFCMRKLSSQVRSLFPNIIRYAALSFPLVELLVMDVFHEDSIHHLSGLKNLVSLDICFTSCTGDFRPKFYSLLNEIGVQLKQLAIYDGNILRIEYVQLNLNVVFDKCPNLESLVLTCKATVDKYVQPRVNPLSLKHLSVFLHNANREKLLFLLLNSVHLKTLFLPTCYALEDGTLNTILQKNPFSELEVADITSCSVSRLILRKFIQSSRMLKKIYFRSSLLTDVDIKESIDQLNPNATYYDHPLDPSREQLPRYRYQQCSM